MKLKIGLLLMIIGATMLTFGLVSGILFASVDPLTLTIEPMDTTGLQFNVYGYGAEPNEYLGLVEFDGVNTWNLVVTAYADDNGDFAFGGLAFSSTDIGTVKTFRVHVYGLTEVSNEVTITIGEGLDPTDPTDPEDPDYPIIDIPNTAAPYLCYLGGGTAVIGAVVTGFEHRKKR